MCILQEAGDTPVVVSARPARWLAPSAPVPRHAWGGMPSQAVGQERGAMTAPRITNRQLLATCWTWAGDAAPARGDERSPVSIRDRVAAVAAAGWSGIGLLHADLQSIEVELGYPGLRSLVTD